MTNTEQILWELLRKNKVMGYRFKAQHPISKFIADFYCHKLKLVIEVDGEIHKNQGNIEYDIGRTDELNKYGVKVIRYSNDNIMNNLSEVKQKIISECVSRRYELTSPLQGI